MYKTHARHRTKRNIFMQQFYLDGHVDVLYKMKKGNLTYKANANIQHTVPSPQVKKCSIFKNSVWWGICKNDGLIFFCKLVHFLLRFCTIFRYASQFSVNTVIKGKSINANNASASRLLNYCQKFTNVYSFAKKEQKREKYLQISILQIFYSFF